MRQIVDRQLIQEDLIEEIWNLGFADNTRQLVTEQFIKSTHVELLLRDKSAKLQFQSNGKLVWRKGRAGKKLFVLRLIFEEAYVFSLFSVQKLKFDCERDFPRVSRFLVEWATRGTNKHDKAVPCTRKILNSHCRKKARGSKHCFNMWKKQDILRFQAFLGHHSNSRPGEQRGSEVRLCHCFAGQSFEALF